MSRHPKQKSKQKLKANFKSIFIVDPVKGERLHLAKLLKQEKLFMMTFVNLIDCFKHNNPIKPDLIVYVLRKGKSELTHMKNIKNHFGVRPLCDYYLISKRTFKGS